MEDGMMKRRTNLILIILMLLSLLLTAFLGYTLIKNKNRKIIPDLVGKNEKTAMEWCAQLDPGLACNLIYEESDTAEKDIVFYQSLAAGTVIKNQITIKISSGKDKGRCRTMGHSQRTDQCYLYRRKQRYG